MEYGTKWYITVDEELINLDAFCRVYLKQTGKSEWQILGALISSPEVVTIDCFDNKVKADDNFEYLINLVRCISCSNED